MPNVPHMKHIAALLILCGLATTAEADVQTGFYIGAGVGQANVKAESAQDLGLIVQEFDSSATSFKVFAGWRINSFLAVEAAYLDFGNPNVNFGSTNVETSIKGGAPYLIGFLPIGPIELFAKVGYFFYDLDVDVAGRKVEQASGSQDDITYGIGGGIVVFKRLEARLEYEYVDTSGTLKSTDAVWLSAAWRF